MLNAVTVMVVPGSSVVETWTLKPMTEGSNPATGVWEEKRKQYVVALIYKTSYIKLAVVEHLGP
jgi:hypothetical protein